MWNLVRDAEAFQAYLRDFAGVAEIPVEAIAVKPPAEYPCLAVAVRVADPLPRILAAYVYPADARALLQSDNATSKIARAAEQDNYNRWVSAHLLTLVSYLVDTGICRPEQYEECLLAKLELVSDVVNKRRRDLFDGLAPEQQNLLRRLYPEAGV